MNFKVNAIVRSFSVISCAIVLSGCAMPLPFQIASWALDGISYITTEKSVTDHGISIVAQKDCALLRVIQGNDICSTYDDSGTIAVAETSNEDTTDEITVMSVGGEIVNTGSLAEVEKKPQLPEPPISNYVNVQPGSEQNPRLLISGTRVWSDRMDADMYYVVGSFSNWNYAQSLISKHNDLGPAVLVSLLNGNKIYRVAVGPFKSYQRRDVKLSIEKSGISNAWAMHINHQNWNHASPQEFFNKGRSVALAPEIIEPIIKIKSPQEQVVGGEVAEIPVPKDKLSMNRWL